jgi:acetyl/propionyl-CoA carboxylase alpha subunit
VTRDFEVLIGEAVVAAADGWQLEWVDRDHGVARIVDGERSLLILVEGSGSGWSVTLRGRRIPVSVRTWRERVMAAADTAARAHAGPVEVKATLPGLVVAIGVGPGDEVEAGAPLLTIEAMKMQNEVRAPRAGRVIEVVVSSGQTVATGASLLRLE